MEVGRYLELPYPSVFYWSKKLGYRPADGRTRCWPERRRLNLRRFDHSAVDWLQPNILLARRHKVSRERIRQLRNQLGQPKVRKI